MAMKSESQDKELVKRALAIMKELGEEGTEEEQKEFMKKRGEAERAGPGQALQAAVEAMEQMLVASVRPQIIGSLTADGEHAGNSVVISGKKAHLIKARLREILWIVKDALGLFKDAGDQLGKGMAQKALARVHLCRSYEPDAPAAALRAAKDAIATFHGLDDEAREALAYLAASDAHLTKAGLSPYDKVVEDENENAGQAARQAIALFKKIGDKKGEAKALNGMASTLLSSNDEDRQLDAERYIEEAVKIFKEIKETELECNATMTAVSARLATSGPQAAIGFAKDCALDWKREGARPAHEGMALHAASEIHLSLGELDECMEQCNDAMRYFERASSKKGKAGVLQTMLQVAHAKGNTDKIIKTAEEVAALCQEVGDLRGAGSALASVADLMLNNLVSEVKQDTEATTAKKDAPVGLSPEEVGQRAEDGLDFANRAFIFFEEIGDEPGMAEVQNIIQGVFQKGVDIYCTATEPDRIYTTLELEGPKEKESVLEWSIDFPHSKRLIMKA